MEAPPTETNQEHVNITELLTESAKFFGLDKIAPGRFSLLLTFQICEMYNSQNQSIHRIIDEIKYLEGIIKKSSTKEPTIFSRNASLKGLWHKHYVQSSMSSHAQNLRRALIKYQTPTLKQREAEYQNDPTIGLSMEDIQKIAHESVFSNWERLNDESSVTGEWIIFAKHNKENYYLCLGNHNSGDENIRNLIDNVCVKEFSFLHDILAPLT